MSDDKILVGDMSRKQCLEVLKRLLEVMEVFDGISPSPERINALKMAIASLETDEAYQLEYERTTKNDLGVDCKTEDYINKRELIQKGMMGCDANGKMLFFIDAKELDSLPGVHFKSDKEIENEESS